MSIEDRTNAELEQQVRETKPVARGRRFIVRGGGNGHGYASQPRREYPPVADESEVVERIAAATALIDEPESPGPAVVDAQADLAAHYDALRRAREIEAARANRRGLSIENRMADARRRAKVQHVDVGGDMFVVEKMVKRAQRAGNTHVPEAALERMEKVEALLDGPAERRCVSGH